ncbi:MAG: hypothetical protein P8X74_22860 [Reinekea sp.]
MSSCSSWPRPLLTFHPAGAVEVMGVAEEAADVDAHYRHVRA